MLTIPVFRFLSLLALASPLLAADVDKGDANGEPAEWDVNDPGGEWYSIDIDTTETTWSNVDVSPDGQTIVFDMLGDIYAVPMSGGESVALTSGIAWNMQPRFSPDGQSIVFISDRNGGDNIWIMAADGSEPKEVSKERNHMMHNPAWSPDGQWIVARKGYVSTRSIPSGELWLYHRSGGGGLQVIERPDGAQSQKNIAEPIFSIDGRYIYYSQDTTPGRVWQYNKDATGQIFVVQRFDRQRGETEVYVSGPGGAIRPTPSPDGKQLAFVKRLPDMRSAIYLKDLSSGNERPIYQDLDRDLQETAGSHGNTPAIAWTPQADALVFWAGGKIHRVRVDGGEVSTIPIRIKDQRKLRRALRFPVAVAPDEVAVKMPRWAQYSPDGKQVVFQALGYLYIKDAASGEQRRLTRQTEHFEFWPSFSADGKSIVYTTWNDQQLGSVRVVSSRGGRGRVVTTQPGHYVEPRFAADGSQLVYRKISGGYLLSPKWSQEPGIYIVPAKGGEPLRVIDHGFNPQFSADGQRIIFSDRVDNTKLSLNSVDLQGLEPREHFRGGKVVEFRVSPDARWVAFVEHYTVYVAPFAVTGKSVDLGQGTKTIPVAKVSGRAGESIVWAADGSSLHWSHGPLLYRRELSDTFAFLAGAPDTLPEPATEGLDLSFTVTADRPDSTIALTNARVITMRQADRFEEVIQNGTVLVEGNRIVAVGRSQEVDVPAQAFVLDLSGKTIVPGLVDAHAHGGMGRDEITPQQNWMQYSNLAFGVTTIHDPSNDTTEIFSHAEMQRTGQVLGPRTFSTGAILYGALSPQFTTVVDSLDDAKFHLQRLHDVGAISVKSYNQLRRDSRQQIIQAADELEMMVVPEGGMKFQHNMTHIVDGHTGIEHALPIAHVYNDVIQLWSQSEVGYTPTFGVAYGGLMGEVYWYDRTEVWRNERLMRYVPKAVVLPRAMRRTTAPDMHYNHIVVAANAKKLNDAGVPVQIGAHGQREGLAAHWEMWMMNQGGFSPWQSIRGATIDSAGYLGLDGDIGSIEAGKLADLAIIDGNPLADLSRSEYVTYTMLNGRLYETASMNEVGSGDFRRQLFFFEQEGGDAFPMATQQAMEAKAQAYHWRH